MIKQNDVSVDAAQSCHSPASALSSGGDRYTAPSSSADERYVIAFDTANDTIAIGLGLLRHAAKEVQVIASVEVAARRASNTQLLPRLDALCAEQGIDRRSIACVVCGRGPGSFTGVRIAMATAKGVASAMEVALVGVSSLDAVAWNAQFAGVRGSLAVVADAMRKEVYPVRYMLTDDGVRRLEADRVVKADVVVAELVANEAKLPLPLQLAGDALVKYADDLATAGTLLPEQTWIPTGRGLLLALQDAWRTGEADPLDAQRHSPAFALPVYTRLSDAEENERIRLAKNDPKNLNTGVQDVAVRRDQRASMHDTAILNARASADGVTYKPLDAAHVFEVAALEALVMGSDAWSEALVADELPRTDRIWWAAYGIERECEAQSLEQSSRCSLDALRNSLEGQCSFAQFSHGVGEDQRQKQERQLIGLAGGREVLLGYAGGWIVDGEVQILKVGVNPSQRRRGIARELLARVSADARDLGALMCSLEVRQSNVGAQALYGALDLRSIGVRPGYYADGESAVIMQGPLPLVAHDVAGMTLTVSSAGEITRKFAALSYTEEQKEAELCANRKTFAANAFVPEGAGRVSLLDAARPLILAIETSCDETAAAIVDGKGNLVADVIASQIDFHARFGGVVPEIASRKHVEAICGVCDECFDIAAASIGVEKLTYGDLDSVAVTYAPGLLGALVVGVAFAKGAAWGADKPFIGVNHLEGHLYANKIDSPDFAPPAVVSLVSGGNTMLVHMKDWGNYETLGATIDDAVGEAFDKIAKALGLGYPGGPVISRYAAEGDPKAVAFPRAMLHSGDLRFSLSGLKTAVVTYINKEREARRELNIPNIAASFQQAVIDVQVAKAKRALEQTGAHTFCLGGGVAANPVLRDAYRTLCERMGVRLTLPPLSACGDNAGMIALVALDRHNQGKFFPLETDAQAHISLDEAY